MRRGTALSVLALALAQAGDTASARALADLGVPVVDADGRLIGAVTVEPRGVLGGERGVAVGGAGEADQVEGLGTFARRPHHVDVVDALEQLLDRSLADEAARRDDPEDIGELYDMVTRATSALTLAGSPPVAAPQAPSPAPIRGSTVAGLKPMTVDDEMALRSIVEHVPLYSIELAPAFDPAWIDPVCKMHAPYAAYRRTTPTGPWFCSERCAEAYRRSPETYGGSKASDLA